VQQVPATGAQIPGDVATFLQDSRQANELSDEELLSRVKTARRLSQDNKLPEETRNQLGNILKSARAEALARGQGKQPVVEGDTTQPAQPADATPPAQTDQKQVQVLDGNQANPEVEAKAKAFLNDPVTADKLSDADLSARLNGMRDLMAGNQLSRDTERALRRKLRAERDVLRNRVAMKEAETQAKTPSNNTTIDNTQNNTQNNTQVTVNNQTNNNITTTNNITNVQVVLKDRRPSDQLGDVELRRRIDVYRDVAFNDQYDEQERMYWRQTMEHDRQVLRQRMMEERRRRARELQNENIDVEIGIGSGRPPQRDVFAAEVDDQELEDVLVAPPRRKVQRRYTVEEVESTPELRDALPRVEIDTVHFGFGEAFVREEEVANLDRIGGIMEKILAHHPREVFLIEGHTDAVGSDAANLELSRQRALAVKQALTTYYVISPENIKTVGYGERYLKIPTAEPEPENRRVSVARATSLIGELDQ
jgi:outer membrane protein OmpA-like peptidoglycan-associated protein